MKRTALLTMLLGLLFVETGLLLNQNTTSMAPGLAWRLGFFILFPLALAVLVWLRFRWAAMICVIYATVGLAMDVATIIQMFNTDSDAAPTIPANGVSGFLNFLLIVFGGRSLLDVGEEPMPLKSHPPNPPSPS